MYTDTLSVQGRRNPNTHDTLPFFDAIFFPHLNVSCLPSATSLSLVRGGVGVDATVGNGNSEGEEDEEQEEEGSLSCHVGDVCFTSTILPSREPFKSERKVFAKH